MSLARKVQIDDMLFESITAAANHLISSTGNRYDHYGAYSSVVSVINKIRQMCNDPEVVNVNWA